MMTDYDVIIIGVGPAGAASAITLARAGWRVLCLEKRFQPRFNVGETLPPVAIDIARHFLGPLDTTLAGCSRHMQGNISVWGEETAQQHDFFFTPNGAGLCVDRFGFDRAFKENAQTSGAVLVDRAYVLDCHRDPKTKIWTLRFEADQSLQEVDCHFVIDATGRQASIAKKLGIYRDRDDDLFAYALRFQSATTHDTDAYTRIEACAFGWWYSNALPTPQDRGAPGERVVVLHTDKDLPEAKHAGTVQGFLELFQDSRLIRQHLDQHGYQPTGKIQGAVAGNARSQASCHDGYLAVGDAAQAYDPLSSQGLYQALRSASMAGQAVSYALANAKTANDSGTEQSVFLNRYSRAQAQQWARYTSEYKHFYAAEQRWTDHPFWARRRASISTLQKETARDAL